MNGNVANETLARGPKPLYMRERHAASGEIKYRDGEGEKAHRAPRDMREKGEAMEKDR